jgi:hypothetical protein
MQRRRRASVCLLPPEKVVESIVEKERKILEIMDEIKAMLAEGVK